MPRPRATASARPKMVGRLFDCSLRSAAASAVRGRTRGVASGVTVWVGDGGTGAGAAVAGTGGRAAGDGVGGALGAGAGVRTGAGLAGGGLGGAGAGGAGA